ncbi:uncharacterized protein LOC110989819 isoform X2 [Acanthaster planci]|uniref:Uncharacterized protein LOC110989819 isoform X2 n=1 Tax=Acanthaster planci TaxID=133434 RepID=A0A8B7ZYJ5_ACAPL|nr:uncharacterized protein LOC110989819 isoform X2 [Acanthaster planci]XP_022110161.1 uncharacterized protein LOC110989819 isoform X2 [Acanthaster planci]XP_022110162.1 uncharacterized protein LOC110989819 isoform X2 [Acanthaster planci]
MSNTVKPGSIEQHTTFHSARSLPRLVARKLAGHSRGTAAWATNVGNEHGQVLMSVLTAAEGQGLRKITRGLVERYQDAGVPPPPEVVYVDRDCCGTRTSGLFNGWPNLQVRLDIWHFMRRFASTCSTESHQLYPFFLWRLSARIFSWSAEDVNRLREAKMNQLMARNISRPSDEDVTNSMGKRALACYCRRTTRGVEETTCLIKDLISTLDGEQGRDTMGIPLFDSARIWDIWESQKKHIVCIQDPLGVQLYTKTGEACIGFVELPTYRGSFHNHLNRFIPGTTANDVHYQAYLMDGLVRWNTDRAADAIAADAPEHRVYSGYLQHAVDQLGQRLLGKAINPTHSISQKYTAHWG